MSETSEITGPLIKALNQTGGYAIRMNSGKAKRGKYFIQLHEAGTADIMFFPRTSCTGEPKQPVWIETKIGEYGQTADQRIFQLKVESLGHRYILAKSIDEGLAVL